MSKRRFMVTLELEAWRDEELGQRELMTYIREAVETWGGQLDPEDPRFGLRGHVRVRPLPQWDAQHAFRKLTGVFH
jgi:hypothetical protein